MKLLADESLTGRTRQFLRAAGYELLTVHELGRGGAANGEVLSLATAQHAVLVAEDRGFSSIVKYPLGTHAGIILLKIRRAEDIEAIHRHLSNAFAHLTATELRGCLLIVDRNKYRLRRPV